MTAQASWVWWPGCDATLDVAQLGGKGRQLVRLSELAHAHDARVPAFVVVQRAAFEQFHTAATNVLPTPHATASTVDATSHDTGADPCWDAFAAQLGQALHETALSRCLLAVRSSATDEDGEAASYAGQFETVLGVPGWEPSAVLAAVQRVWRSTDTAHARAYGAQHDRPAVRMSVVVQELVTPHAAGVAFACDPVTGDVETTVVSAVYGLGEGLVSGELDADTWHVHNRAATRFTAARKTEAVRVVAAGGTVREPIAAVAQDAPALEPPEVERIAHVVRALSVTLGAPQDVEWALVDDPRGAERALVLLQTRPVTAFRPMVAPANATAADGTAGSSQLLAPPANEAPRGPGRRVWDNANIVESYAGVTTPLTFTFARSVYEDVYRQFCRLMGVPEPLIVANSGAFAHMLGLVRGRVYYSLINWYRLISLLPGFAWNRAFMERMMGVRESLEAPPPPPDSGSRWRDLARLVRMILRMLRAHRALRHDVPAFHDRVNRALEPLRDVSLDQWDAPRVAALYRTLERELLQHWRPPLVNDFFAMIFFGVQGRLLERWLPHAAPTLGNDLLCGEGGIISTEPARRVMAMARTVRDDASLLAAFSHQPDDAELWRELRRLPHAAALCAALDEYVDVFGDRCLEELKLETVTLREDPAFLLRMVRAYVTQGAIDADAALAQERRVRADAEATVRATVRGWRAGVLFWVIGNTRRRVRDRENLRFERTRVFGVVRRMMLAIGHALVRAQRLADARDVFWLTLDEVLTMAEGGSGPADTLTLVATRRAQFTGWRTTDAPPDRFETTGPLGEWEGPLDTEIPRPLAAAVVTGDLSGTGCCPGVVRAPVRIVRDPRDATSLAGCILVAERTDPGWTLLFPASLGLLVQRGSLLSHSAIVAREMALPCVVGIAGLLDTLVDGEVVEMDGTTGVIRRLANGAP